MIVVGEKNIAYKIVLQTVGKCLKSPFVEGTFARGTILLYFCGHMYVTFFQGF